MLVAYCARRRVPASGGAFLSLLCSFSLCYIVVSLTLSALSDALLWRLPELVFTAGKLRLQRRSRFRPERFSADSLLVLVSCAIRRIGDGASCSVSLSARARVVSGCVAVIFSVGFRVWFKFGGQALLSMAETLRRRLPPRGAEESSPGSLCQSKALVRSFDGVIRSLLAVLFLVWKVMKIKTQWFLLTSPSSGLVDGVWSSVFLLGRSFCQFSAVGACEEFSSLGLVI
ncbi:hypothetical protein F2Q69_00048651 [Brassica cretica]|uniref:Transmembrane protein n=1 Tax=Brassica cretica TaxID=69181 RepID=A0A8S9PTG9_BRACR|nr:hypothetical protein F2Q69_00048651 [Brassica cretica]